MRRLSLSTSFIFYSILYPMKKLLLILFVFPLLTQAQDLSGTINYETTIKLSINIEEGAASQFKHLIPKESKLKNVLHFKGDKSIFLPSEEIDDHEINEQSDNVEFSFHMATPDNKVYHDYSLNSKVESREFMGKYFLINGEPKSFKWKLTGKTKEIAGYVCQQAMFKDTSQTVSAWFAPEITTSAGPGIYGKLPGLILGVEINDGERITMATSISLEKTDEKLIIKPKKGKKVSQQEFDRITEEKMKEMGAKKSGNGNSVQIIIQEDEY